MCFIPTAEQHDIASFLPCPGELVLINAYAGTGKTETLRLIASSYPGTRFLYLCYNKAAAEKAKQRFPANTTCKTIHSLAYSSVGKAYRHKIGEPSARELMAHLQVEQAYLAILTLQTVQAFCHSVDSEIAPHHLPNERLLTKYPNLLKLAKATWLGMTDTTCSLPISHDGYLKLWSLKRPRISASIILLDEAQDTNPVTLNVLLDQRNSARAGLIFVGDTHQSIYSWRHAIDSLVNLRDDADLLFNLTKSFRFGPEIAAPANRLISYYKNDPIQIQGTSSRSSPDPSCVILARHNASLISAAIPIANSGKNIHFAGTNSQSNWNPHDLYKFQIAIDILHLKTNRQSEVQTPYIQEFKNFDDLKKQIDGDKEGDGADDTLKWHLNLVSTYDKDLPFLTSLLQQQCTSPTSADISFSTAHRAKGLEWSTVSLENDFIPLENKNELEPFSNHYLEEINLLYVAITRPTHTINYPAVFLNWLHSEEEL